MAAAPECQDPASGLFCGEGGEGKRGKRAKNLGTGKEFDRLPAIILTWVQRGEMGFRVGQPSGKSIAREEEETKSSLAIFWTYFR